MTIPETITAIRSGLITSVTDDECRNLCAWAYGPTPPVKITFCPHGIPHRFNCEKCTMEDDS